MGEGMVEGPRATSGIGRWGGDGRADARPSINIKWMKICRDADDGQAKEEPTQEVPRLTGR